MVGPKRSPNTGHGRGNGNGSTPATRSGVGASTQAPNISDGIGTNDSPLLGVGASTQAPNISAGTGTNDSPTSLVWQFADASTMYTDLSTSETLATGVPTGAVFYASPDLLPGQTLEQTGDTLSLVSDSTLPDVNGDTAGSMLDTVSDRDIIIEVMDTELAVANHIRASSIIGTYGYGQAQPIWYAVQDLAQDGDIFEISPGAITDDLTLGVGVPSSYLEKAVLKINKSITLRGMTDRGRWRLLPSSFTPTDADNFSGVLILSPGDITGTDWDSDPTTEGRRKTIVVQDFDFDNWGTTGSDHAVKLRSPTEVTDWSQIHTSVTFSNFKVGKLPFYQSASGFSGAAETLIFSDGYVFDTGDGVGAAAGNDHNFYITARYLTMTGVRASRTRSAEYPFNQSNTLDGHILKATFHYATLEGCVFDCGPEGDNSKTIQAKGGGNLIVRGCVLIMGQHAQDVRGGISFEKETGNYGGDWFYGAAGHSLLIEKNVFINHRAYSPPGDALAMVYFYPSGNAREVDPATITSCVIRDNIGMSTVTDYDTYWIQNPPSVFADGDWSTSNSVETYNSSETPFADKLLKSYTRAAGTIAASGTVATYRFTWPHGSIARSDAFRGIA